jgi:hypothetical protein
MPVEPISGADESGDNDLVMLRGLEILREWLAEPEIAEMLEGAPDPKAADVVPVQHD